MAYLRYAPDCDWHVFEDAMTDEGESRLAVWHKDHEAEGASYTMSMIQKMLELEEYSGIPGYQPRYKRMLRDAFEVWLDEQSSAEI
jgi:aminopeptidase N